jgi:hypothetical protein
MQFDAPKIAPWADGDAVIVAGDMDGYVLQPGKITDTDHIVFP